MADIIALFTLIMGKAPPHGQENRGKRAIGKEKLTTTGRASASAMPLGLTILPLPSETTIPDIGGQAVAARIVELARAHGMTLAKDADLASLLAAIHVSDPIPITAFAVVADVLFAILKANQQQQAAQETTP